jgi:hypothetical protein
VDRQAGIAPTLHLRRDGLLLLILGPLAILNTAKDSFPSIGIPVVSVIWAYSGLPPDEMSGSPAASNACRWRR